MREGIKVVAFRCLVDRRGVDRLLHGRRVYEVRMRDGAVRRVSFGELDTLLDARRHPADSWASVHAADSERDRTSHSAEPRMTTWPSGTPSGGP